MAFLMDALSEKYKNRHDEIIVGQNISVRFSDLLMQNTSALDQIEAGAVVALVGDYDPRSVARLLRLFDKKAIIVPLTADTAATHPSLFEAAQVKYVIEENSVRTLDACYAPHPMIEGLRAKNKGGLIFFSSGTTGKPKAILHDADMFLERYRTPRPALRTLTFLLFDHIGGINTLLHTLYNGGTVIVPHARTAEAVLNDLKDFSVEAFPATPTFLRMMLMSGVLDGGLPPPVKLVTYGTERMDEPTLKRLCAIMPDVDFRQTYGLSELGILRITSRGRDSLWIKAGGEGIQTRIIDGTLRIHAEKRMVGYLNAPSPFDEEGWYDTLDLVETDGAWIKIIGRKSDMISVGGLKIMPAEIERAALEHADITDAKAYGVANPITGQHIELICTPLSSSSLTKLDIKDFLRQKLPEQFLPHRIIIGDIATNHRFKRA